jgi:catechol 2,3-dioxygenase-like lactoylglutathione lyase family enzyme
MRRTVLVIAVLTCCVAALASDPPKRPRILGIAKVQLYSTDLRASNKFYSRVLGTMQPTNCGDCDRKPSRLFSVNGLQLVGFTLVPSPAPANLVEEVTFATDNLAALRAYLESQQVPVVLEKKPDERLPRKMPLTVIDPEGHRISFVQWKDSAAAMIPEFPTRHQIIHSGFVVRDRAATDHFYKDILGFRAYWHGGMKDDKDDWVALQVPDGTDWVEYMLNISPTADKHTLGVMNHIAIGVPDIHEARQQLIESGLKPGEEPKLGRDGKWQLNLYDPDDTRVEFMEFTPKEKPCCSEFTGPHPGPKQ